MKLTTIWNGTDKPKPDKHRQHASWGQNIYPRAYSLDGETDANDELPDEFTNFLDEPEPPFRRHINMRHAYCS